MHGAVRDLRRPQSWMTVGVGDGQPDPQGTLITRGRYPGRRRSARCLIDGRFAGAVADWPHGGRRADRLVNPLLSNLPAFSPRTTALTRLHDRSIHGGLAGRGESPSCGPGEFGWRGHPGLQEDHLSNATPGALALKIIDNAETVLTIELLAASQAYGAAGCRGPRRAADAAYRRVRAVIPHYRDDRPWALISKRLMKLARPPGGGIHRYSAAVDAMI